MIILHLYNSLNKWLEIKVCYLTDFLYICNWKYCWGMKKIILLFVYIHFFVFGVMAQNDSVAIAALKEEIKREVIAELRDEVASNERRRR